MEVYRIEEGEIERMRESQISRENTLEDYLISVEGAEIGSVKILYISKQRNSGHGGTFDILGIDEEGNAVIIELKRGRTPRDVMAQALEYASSIRGETYGELEERYQEFLGNERANLQKSHMNFFGDENVSLSEDQFNSNQRIIVVARGFSDIILKMANFLRDFSIDVVCVTYNAYSSEDEGYQLLTTENILYPIADVEPESQPSPPQEYSAELRENGENIRNFPDSDQANAMAMAVEFLIDEHNLLDCISIPYTSGGSDWPLIFEKSNSPEGIEDRTTRPLSNGLMLDANWPLDRKSRLLNELAEYCNLSGIIERSTSRV